VCEDKSFGLVRQQRLNIFFLFKSKSLETFLYRSDFFSVPCFFSSLRLCFKLFLCKLWSKLYDYLKIKFCVCWLALFLCCLGDFLYDVL
jgi:hypothetical protein